MNEIITKYGIIHGISTLESYSDGSIKECKLNEYNELETSYGILVPQYTEEEARRKYITSLSFYDSGNIKAIALQEQSRIETRYGSFPVELVTFYESGCVKRLFPLNGKITGYWTEDNEYDLCEEFELKLEFGSFKKKIIGILFYESGYIKSITFWPKDSIDIQTPAGPCNARIGMSFYENGHLKSCEPSKPTLVETPIGSITAYNTNVLGINGDINSLNFYENGKIKALITSTDRIIITDKANNIFIHEPSLKPNLFNNTIMDIVPVSIDFKEDKVIFNKDPQNSYDISSCLFNIEHFKQKINAACTSCSSCTGCIK